MVETNYIWDLQKTDDKVVDLLSKELKISKVLAKLLVIRGVFDFKSAQKFFRPNWGFFHDGFQMKDMLKSVERLFKSIENEENILIYGDYDVDGTCSVAMMSLFLKSLNANVLTYQPDREEEGYGISLKSLDWMINNNIDLVVSLDCGIKDLKSAKAIKEANIDLVICDHHNPGAELPVAYSILNPKQQKCNYPFKELCGCGVGLKLIQSYVNKYNIDVDLSPLIQLAAIATTADIVPLIDENRVITYLGINEMNNSPISAVEKLFQIAQKKGKVSTSDIVFKIAPRINAAGRLSNAKKATELLMSTKEDIENLINEIETINKERRQMDEMITIEALEQLSNQSSGRVTNIVYSPNWHKGVVGIVASRIIESFYKPTIVFTGEGDTITGSARSVKDFDIYQVLEKLKHYFIRFGGHKYAAGLTIKKSDLIAFSNDFENEVQKTILPNMLIPKIKIDSELSIDDLIVESSAHIFPKVYRIINQMEPFGPSNPKPIFLFKNILLNESPKIVGQKHMRFKFSSNKYNFLIDGIWFNSSHNYNHLKNIKSIDLVAALNENHFNGVSKLQLIIKDVKFKN